MIMVDEENLKWEINSVRESIEFDWANLASKSLTADKRKAFREHLEICVSTLRKLVERNRSASQNSKLGDHQRQRRPSTK
jgi:hypothetical protein